MLAVHDGLHVHQMDDTTTFLNKKLKEEVYMEQPKGFVVPGRENVVCRLKQLVWLKTCTVMLELCARPMSKGPGIHPGQK